jgi:uncharacterized UPF0160 family protein
MSNDDVQEKPARMRIGTHDGKFHADDALACYMLRKLADYDIVRWVN